jgi:glycosyltransferase involved in cell wall biosynthesis
MKTKQQKILIIGLFLSATNSEKINRSAADQLAELFSKNGFPVITVSNAVSKMARLFDTVFTIIRKSADYKIAIVPLYGTFFSYWWAYISCVLLQMLRKKILLIIHGGSIPDRMKTNHGKYLRAIRKADVVVCPSPFIKNTLEQFSLESVLIENVISLEDYKFCKKESFQPRILWMRTLHEIYNPEMAVRVTALLSKKYPDVKMAIAGRDDGSLKKVTDLATQLNVSNLIELPGYLNKAEKNKYASTHDIYICTNRIDNAPVSLIEMMALGLPVVSVDVGGIPFLITNEVNGLLVNLDDDEAMADAISLIIEQPLIGKELVRNGLDYCKQFDEVPVLEKWRQVFSNLDHLN